MLQTLLHASEGITQPAIMYAVKKHVTDITDRETTDNFDWIIVSNINPDSYKDILYDMILWNWNTCFRVRKAIYHGLTFEENHHNGFYEREQLCGSRSQYKLLFFGKILLATIFVLVITTAQVSFQYLCLPLIETLPLNTATALSFIYKYIYLAYNILVTITIASGFFYL